MTDASNPDTSATPSGAPWIENFIIDQTRTPARAMSVVDWSRENFSARRYEGSDRTLSFRWSGLPRFDARAAIDPDRPNEHIISFSDRAPRLLYRDVAGFVRLCTTHFTDPHYDLLFGHELYDYGQGRACVLPRGMDEERGIDQMFRLTLAWLYLHEQAHLFQGHLLLEGAASHRMLREAGHLIISEGDGSRSGLSLTSEQAAVSHVTELAADAEATQMAAQLIVVGNEGVFSQASLWFLVCGLMCLFQRFYGDANTTPGDEAVGTHPMPTFRMRMALRQLMAFACHPDVRERAPWVTGPDVVQRLFDHASTTASIFWTIRSLSADRKGLPPFFEQVHAFEPLPAAYSQSLLAAWLGIRGHVESHYFGWFREELPFDPSSILDLS